MIILMDRRFSSGKKQNSEKKEYMQTNVHIGTRTFVCYGLDLQITR